MRTSKSFKRLSKIWLENIDDLKYSTDYTGSNQLKVTPSLGKNAPDWRNILNDPPLNSSSETLQELKIVQAASNKAIKSGGIVVQKILDVDKNMDGLFLKAAEVKHFTSYEKQIMETFYQHLHPVIINLKNKYDRPRPYQLGSLLDVPVKHITTSTHHTAAFPSGHTAYGAMMARILSYTRPEKSMKFYDVQNEIADARVSQGVHYPSDNMASIILVETIWKFFKNNVLDD